MRKVPGSYGRQGSEEGEEEQMGQETEGGDTQEEEEEVRPARVSYRPGSYGRQGSEEGEEEQMDQETEGGDTQEEEEDRPSGPMLAIKSKEERVYKQVNAFKMRSNPFKVSTPQQSSGVTKGTQVFDSLTKKKERAAALSMLGTDSKPQKKPSQPKIFLKKKQDNYASTTPVTTVASQKSKSGFDMWLDENKQRLKEDNPEADEDDFSKYAAEQFRALPKEERQAWVKKAKSNTEKSKENEAVEVANDEPENKKCKRDDGDSEESVKKLKDSATSDLKKKPLSQNTNLKLAGFAFKKDKS